MALKLVINDPVEVIGPFRDEYKKGDDGKFHLVLDGDHPDSVKLAEFRTNNRALNTAKTELEAKLAAFADVDPEEYRRLKGKPDVSPKVAELEAGLAAERAAHEATKFKNLMTFEFLNAGVRESAVDFVFDKASKDFTMKDGKPTTELFSEKTPGEHLSVEEWLTKQMGPLEFCFKPSRGGGAGGSGSGGPAPRRVISNDPLTVGQNLEAIARGDVTVE